MVFSILPFSVRVVDQLGVLSDPHMFSHHMGIPCNAVLCDIIYVVIGLTDVALQNISFLIRSFLILR